MNLKQLFENAALDSFGLLDKREVEVFELALRQSPASVRTSISSLQERLLQIDLPPELSAEEGNIPPADLRERVLATVTSEIAAAAIGAQHADVIGMVGAGGVAGGARSQRISPWWRAAAIGSLAAALVLGVTVVMQQAAFRQIDTAVRNSEMVALSTGYGDSFEGALLAPKTRFMQFAVQGTHARNPAAIILIGERGEGHLVARDLSQTTGRFALVSIRDDGRSEVVATLSGPRAAMKIPASAMPIASTLAIVPFGMEPDAAVLRSMGTTLSATQGGTQADRLAMLAGLADDGSMN